MRRPIDPILTIADMDAMPEDGNHYEIIEGELFVSCAPSLTHQLILSNIIAIVRAYLDRNPIGIVVPGPGVILTDISGVIPDVVFLSNERRAEIARSERIMGAPELVVE